MRKKKSYGIAHWRRFAKGFSNLELRKEKIMFSVRQKRKISEKVQQILKETNHPELPEGEVQFLLHVDGAESWSWADIKNNGAITTPSVNPWNEEQDFERSK